MIKSQWCYLEILLKPTMIKYKKGGGGFTGHHLICIRLFLRSIDLSGREEKVMGEGNSDFWPCKRERERQRERFKIDNDRCSSSSSSSYLSFLSHSPFIMASRPKLGKKEEKFSGNNNDWNIGSSGSNTSSSSSRHVSRNMIPPYSPGLKSPLLSAPIPLPFYHSPLVAEVGPEIQRAKGEKDRWLYIVEPAS